MLKEVFNSILVSLENACLEVYGDKLISLCVFGSVAAGKMKPDSDIDVLVVCHDLPRGRIPRIRGFEAVDQRCDDSLEKAKRHGVHTTLSPIIKTPDEVLLGSPVFLDMTDTLKVLHDRDGFFENYLDGLRGRLREMGSRRVPFGGGYYWILKPDLKPGEEITL